MLKIDMTEENKTISPPNPASPADKPTETTFPPPPAVVNDFNTQFKDKLTELRGQANETRQKKARENLDKIMEYALKTQKVVNDDVERITGVKDAQATKYLNTLVKQGKLVKFGKTANIFYKPASLPR